MALPKRSHRWPIDIWPGFVDALSTLLIIIIFVLMVFVLAQFLLGYAMFGQTQEIGRLSMQVKTLNEQLLRERREGDSMRRDKTRLGEELAAARRAVEESSIRAADLSAQLVEAHHKAETDARTLAAQTLANSTLRGDLATTQTLKANLEAEVTALGGQLGESESRLAEERAISAEAQRGMVSLREDLARLAAALALAERQTATQQAEITSLSGWLEVALASKVEELARYRSEFFGRLRAALGEQTGIRIEGDRFVFQSEVLFDAGSATLGDSGKSELAAGRDRSGPDPQGSAGYQLGVAGGWSYRQTAHCHRSFSLQLGAFDRAGLVGSASPCRPGDSSGAAGRCRLWRVSVP